MDSSISYEKIRDINNAEGFGKMKKLYFLFAICREINGVLVESENDTDPEICEPLDGLDFDAVSDDVICPPGNDDEFRVAIYVVHEDLPGCYYQNEKFLTSVLANGFNISYLNLVRGS